MKVDTNRIWTEGAYYTWKYNKHKDDMPICPGLFVYSGLGYGTLYLPNGRLAWGTESEAKKTCSELNLDYRWYDPMGSNEFAQPIGIKRVKSEAYFKTLDRKIESLHTISRELWELKEAHQEDLSGLDKMEFENAIAAIEAVISPLRWLLSNAKTEESED